MSRQLLNLQLFSILQREEGKAALKRGCLDSHLNGFSIEVGGIPTPTPICLQPIGKQKAGGSQRIQQDQEKINLILYPVGGEGGSEPEMGGVVVLGGGLRV